MDDHELRRTVADWLGCVLVKHTHVLDGLEEAKYRWNRRAAPPAAADEVEAVAALVMVWVHSHWHRAMSATEAKDLATFAIAAMRKPAAAGTTCEHPSDAVRWNPFNAAHQCHLCGHTFWPETHDRLVKERDAAEAASASHCRVAVEMQRQRDEADRELLRLEPLRGTAVAKVKELEADKAGLQIDIREFIKERDAARADAAKLRDAILRVLDDDESQPGGWGPDVTMQGVLRAALAASRAGEG